MNDTFRNKGLKAKPLPHSPLINEALKRVTATGICLTHKETNMLRKLAVVESASLSIPHHVQYLGGNKEELIKAAERLSKLGFIHSDGVNVSYANNA